MNPIIRLLNRLKPAGDCWEFQGYCGPYGVITVSGSNMNTHRYAYLLVHGYIPNGMQVLHKCDNPRCCNPDHLELGTHQDNHRQKAERGRAKNQWTKSKTKCIDDDRL